MKLLCIGNSFSEDATRYLEALSGYTFKVRNLYIGGCSLETHCAHIGNGQRDYAYQELTSVIEKVSLDEAIEADDWDIVTVQQVSSLSGIPSSYEPFLGQLLAHIRSKRPRAKILFHETWAYETGSNHPSFANYQCDRAVMETSIEGAVSAAVAPYRLPVIPTGKVIAALRRLPSFNPQAGGIPLSRDGYHLSLTYGRYAAGLAFWRFLTGADASAVSFVPEFTEPSLCTLIQKTVNETVTPWEGANA